MSSITSDLPHIIPSDFPSHWQTRISTLLNGQEQILAWLEIDLDNQLHFSPGLLIVTTHRILARSEKDENWQAWSNQPDMKLTYQDHAGICSIELFDIHARLACWHCTLEKHQAIDQLIAHFVQLITAETAQTGEAPANPDEGTEIESDSKIAIETDLADSSESIATGNQETNTAPPSTWTLFRLWRFAKPYKWQLLTGFMLMLGSTAAALVPPYLTMPLMDNVLIPYQNGHPIDTGLVTFYLSGLLGAAVLAWILGWLRTYTMAKVSERIGADLRTTTYEHLLGLSQAYFGGKRTGDLMARIGAETDRINMFLSLNLLDFATDVLMITLTVIILVSINPWLALITLLPLPIIAWLIHLVRDRLRVGFEKTGRVWAEVNNVLADTLPGIRVVKAFAQEEREIERFRIVNQRNVEINDRVNKIWALFTPTVTFLTECGLLVVWIFGIWQVSQDHITVGVLTAFLAYIGRFYLRLDSMSRIVSATQKAAAGTKRIFDILDHVSSVPEPVKPIHLPAIKGHIGLSNVSFRYGTRRVIQNLDFAIKPGEMIGLVGHSGSGKSTLINLICRFYDVTDGAILIDDVDIRSLPIAEYRKHIGLVLQEPFLFFGTIAENIAYGRPNASRREIIAAARAAYAHEFILRLPYGYDSLVGERGQALSGGERQRISIARALLIDPRILILDEATSSVDTQTEQEIQGALDNLVSGRTTIAVAHRLSTLQQANRLVVLDHGKIVEVGNHEELMDRRGHYYQLYQAQSRSSDDEEQPAAAGKIMGIRSNLA
ncbi:ABC transporter ATP-binding protein [Nitrosomonas sp.]|uniref:cyanophycin metabolism-associated ABC transporter n=1 Tax=Nitrosomonas sp. TaxID=42353 RepID=UPI0025ED6BDD|nr:ABC transporter ATP-binding protein [Nitrosomonas sp.]MCC6916264.1 ABC transporter ATP-binding protein [Nitrosomonas sp.]